MNETIHEWDGAYVLGALSPEDRRRYEAHLAECAECTASVQAMAGLPGLLGRLDRAEALELRDLPETDVLRDGAHVAGRAAGVARRARASRRRVRLATTLVLVGVLAGGSALTWSAVRAQQPVEASATATTDLRPVGRSGLSAHLTATSVGWGTRLDWSCVYRPADGESEEHSAPVSYSLVVHTDSGASTTVATWSSDAGEANGLIAATSIPADTIASIDIRTTGSSEPLARARL